MFSGAVGLGTRADHPALGVPRPSDERRRHRLRQRHQRRLRRHRARAADGAAHADPGLRLLGGRDDLVRPQRASSAGARRSCRRELGLSVGGVGGAAGEVGAHRGNGRHAVRRRARRLAPPALRDGAGDRRGARPAAGRSAGDLAPHRSGTWACSRPVFALAFFCLSWYNGPMTAVIFDVVPRADQRDGRRRLPALHPPGGRRDRAAARGQPVRPVRARPGGAAAAGGGDRGRGHGWGRCGRWGGNASAAVG